jgi:hypothetical protein
MVVTLSPFAIIFCSVEGGMPESEERFRIAFWDDLEQDASTVSALSRRDAGRPECFAPRTVPAEKALFSHVHNVSREGADLLNLCKGVALMSS